MPCAKPFYRSKTFWLNFLGALAVVASQVSEAVVALTGFDPTPVITLVLVLGNLVLRARESEAQGALTLTQSGAEVRNIP